MGKSCLHLNGFLRCHARQQVWSRNQDSSGDIDIDGDRCHHAHNAAKKFCGVFQQHVEKLFSVIFSDFKWSADLRQIFEEMCDVLGIKYTVPQRYVSHRWLSVYDVALDHVRLSDVLIVFYHSFISKRDQALYHPFVAGVFQKRKITSQGRNTIRSLQGTLAKKNMTQDGKDRKARMVQRLFYGA